MSSRRKSLHNRKALKQKRRRLRNQPTAAEAALWKMLRKSQLQGRKFRRQQSIGSYIVDFYCPAEKLAVELDGEVHNDPTRRDYDDDRTAFLRRNGIRTVRFENRMVFEQPEHVLQAIAEHFADPEAP